MWSRYMTPAVGKRLSNQLTSFCVVVALGEISLNSAMFRCPSALLVFADQQTAVGEVHVRRNLEVVRRRLVPEYASGHVEGRAMAWAEEASLPVIRQRRLRAGLELVGRRAAQVSANANAHPQFRLDGAPLVLGV